MENEGCEKDLRPEDMLANEERRYDSEEDNIVKAKEKPMMNIIEVYNIVGIDPKPFDRKTFVEEDAFAADESGNTKRIRLENNIVRYRHVRNHDGTTSKTKRWRLPNLVQKMLR